MKKEYVDFDFSVILFQDGDIVTTSGLLGFGTGSDGIIDFETLFGDL